VQEASKSIGRNSRSHFATPAIIVPLPLSKIRPLDANTEGLDGVEAKVHDVRD
jgi:hypothetical protein